jgi:hypothetical protein
MKRLVTVVAVAFAVGLAVVIGNRMSADAMAVVVGVVCGVMASVPTSLLLVWALGRRGQGNWSGTDTGVRNGMGANFPPVVVVNPGPGYGAPTYGLPPASSLDQGPPVPGGPRTFKVVGEEETMLDELRHVFPGLAENRREGR